MVCLFFLFSLSLQADEIGYIDMSLISQKSKQILQFQENYKEKEEDYYELVKKKNKPIEEAVAKGKSDEKIEEMKAKAEEELLPRQRELVELRVGFEKSFLLNIETTAKKIAEEYGIDVVVAKEVVFYGGFDITDLVLEKINN